MAAKGLAFDTVILPQLSARNMPDPRDVEALGGEEAMAGDGRLLYVGVTWARQNLIMTLSGELTPLMPANRFEAATAPSPRSRRPLQRQCPPLAASRCIHPHAVDTANDDLDTI
jgi:hypothetical protein